MTDIVSVATRSRMMSGIQAEGTRPERVVARILGQLGVHHSMHVKDLPGTPDFVLPDHHAAIRVHGCFWHFHECGLSKVPHNNAQFWQKKLLANRSRDESTAMGLIEQRWRVLTIWECALRGTQRWTEQDLTAIVAGWLAGDDFSDEIMGRF